MFSVKDKIIIITGGLGLLGSQFVEYLLEQGAKVAIFDLVTTPRPQQLRFANLNLYMQYVDVTKKEEIELGLKHVQARWGIPHGLINCAAIDFPPKKNQQETFETYPEESWDKVMDVNVKGVFLCCQVIGAAMVEAGRGSIINIGSTYGMVSPDQRIYTDFTKPISYSASKSALLNMTRYLATYWGKRNVRVNTLTFGGVENSQDKQFINNYCEKVPLGRMARKDEYNGAVQFLLSDASSYMTGANMVLDGGWTAW